jgi:conjugative relaxase-like TrwC/TraI family protein
MLRISTLKSASDYYTKSLTKGDYYSEQFEISGEWQGLGASRLGVFGEINKEQFDLICAGHHPLTGDQLSSRLVSDRREAYDFTFSVPKSVSVLSAVSSPEVASLIQDQIKESMKFTMTEVEKNIQTRIRESGKNDNRITGNIVYGYFLHKNARPIDGYSDPHLHIHAVVMNLTFDGVDKKWKAIQMRDKHENREFYQSIFNSTLANRLQNLDLRITKTNINFEISGITDQTIKTFSRRTDEIEKEAIAQNIYTSDAKGKLGARTRQSKSDKHSQSELQSIYQNLLSTDQKLITQSLSNQLQTRIDNNQIDYKVLDQNLVANSEQSKNIQESTNHTTDSDQTKKWLDYTLEHHFERHSTSSEQRLIGEVLKSGIGQTSLELVTKQLEQYKKEGILIDELTSDKVDLERIEARNNLSPAITTQVALAEERSIIATINSQMIIYRPVNSEFANSILQDQFLSQNQKETISKILKSSDGVTLLEGKAGTGKTTTLKAINQGLQQANYSVTVLAPTTKAVEVLQSEGFVDAITVQKYLVDSGNTKVKDSNHLNYLIIDEASLVSVRQMDKLLKLTTQNSQRVLLVGDTKQHKSVERGNTLKVIQNHSQIQTHSLYKIQRQTSSDAKLAVQDLSNGNTVVGIEKFEQLGFVQEIKDDDHRLAKVAQIYVDNLPKVYANKVSKLEIQKLENATEYSKFKNEQPKQNFLSRIFGGNKNSQETQHNQKQFETETRTKITSNKIEYSKLNPQAPTLVITPTHKDGHLIHASIRDQLKKRGLIDSQDYTIDTLLQFSRNIGQFKRGDRYEVVEKSNSQEKGEQKQIEPQIQLQVQIQNTRTSEIKDLPIQNSTYFDTYQKISLQFSKGDLIQSQSCGVVNDPNHPDKERQLTNGAIYQIQSISPKTGAINLTNNWIVHSDFGNLKSAYYSTSQASQGQTATHSIFYTSNQSLPLLNQEMVYVANSRFKQTNTILTPNLVEFKQQASKGEMKSLAIEVTLPKELTKPAPYTPSFKPTIDHGLSKSKGVKR